MRKLISIVVSTLSCFAQDSLAREPEFDKRRAAMVENIRLYARSYRNILGQQGISADILDAMRQTRRHLFLPKRYRGLAYADRPVSIGRGQTISQPFIVALMTHLARLQPSDTVLEVGTGSGYQAAILSRLVQRVCSVEIISALGEKAEKRLVELGYRNVRVKIGDGYAGWPQCAPFDAIIVTAALDHVPAPLIKQLKVGGRLVMPVGPAGAIQQLSVVSKTGANATDTKLIAAVRFVPFTRDR